MPTPTPKIDETKLTLQELIKLTNKVFQQNKEPELSLNLRKLLSDPKSIANSYPTVGDFYYKNGDYEKAAQIYDVGIKSDLLNLVPLQKRMIEVKVAQKQLPDAQELAETLIKKYPNDSDAIAIRATLKLFVGKPEEQAGAIADLQSTVSKMPDNFVLRFNLGRGLLQQGNTQAAQAQFQESIKLRPEYIPPRLALAQIQLQARDWSKALTSGNEILAINSSNISARLIRTSALMGMAAFTQARQELEETLSLYPSSNDARYQLGFIDFQEKKFADAEKQFRQLYETNPADSRGLMGLCEIFMARGDFDSALNILKKEIVRHPGQLNLLLALGNMATRANKFDEAIAVYAQLLEKNPADAAMHAKLGSAYRSKGEVNKATEHFKKAIELAPTDPAAYTELAIVLETNGNHAQAKPIYEKVLALQPDSLVALNNLAFMLAEDGSDLDRALTLAQRARQVSGSDPNVADTLGWIYIKKNLPDNAIGLFTELIRKYPNHPSLAAFQMHLGMAYAQRGDKASARKAFEAALLAKPSEKDKQEIQALLEKMN